MAADDRLVALLIEHAHQDILGLHREGAIHNDVWGTLVVQTVVDDTARACDNALCRYVDEHAAVGLDVLAAYVAEHAIAHVALRRAERVRGVRRWV